MPPPKLLDQVRERIRVIRDGLRTGPPAQASAPSAIHATLCWWPAV